MSSMSDFYIRSRGLEAIAEEWKADHERLQSQVWPLEDVIREYANCARFANELYVSLCEHGMPPHSPISLSSFIDQIEHFISVGRDLLQCAERLREQFSIEGLTELQSVVALLSDIVNEDRFATRMAQLNLSE